MQTARYCCIVPRLIFTPTRTRFINIQTHFLFLLDYLRRNNLMEHNSFDKSWNYVFSNSFYNLVMYISSTIITLDPHNNQFDIIFIFKLNNEHKKHLQPRFQNRLIGVVSNSVCFITQNILEVKPHGFVRNTCKSITFDKIMINLFLLRRLDLLCI